MQPFTTLQAVAVPLDVANIDTDQILPARFLKKPRSAGYGNFLFHDERRRSKAVPLDAPAYAGAGILVADRNFGCGSSREGAVYALVDGGIRCVVAPSFGDIFASNAAKNGLLTVTLPDEAVSALRTRLAAAPGAAVTVDLPAQTVTDPDGHAIPFEIDPFKKRCLVEGLDDVALTLEHAEAIAAYEARVAAEAPWRVPSVAG
ncbi:3-isopropylmalate dehydratase [Methylobacterium indicum]|uniref:3-isopropylmalate dehydratase small subunit n=1 Tax=Methylobacterium indicum TaxID=1775910 RepID=UPI000734EA24|nr:3-isopropylmalate dehydratase small subunit [Methylobacterium indicum]KTS20307.1 3-isopropylmalate dehydratase [Methylobacterium indicum]KTS37527.1 3-isopropylmalate dehydratase [Methylobacterium indicum]KTS51272.1 3-isopropylmalate dehydratase [Methylobacterium indicum]